MGTTVVEVGVDVPEATMMVIEGADRFGLAQLHQLRGRVGRGSVDSFCVLVSDSTDEVAQARLKAVAELRDGFELAETDFELRREGNVLGLAQSGLPQLRVASLQDKGHQELAVQARAHAETLLDERGDLGAGADALAARWRMAGSGAWPPARPARTTRTDDRCLTPGGSSPVVPAGSASPDPAARPGRSATASSRPCSRSSSPTCRTRGSWTCSRGVARPASRRSRAAPAT